MNSLFVLGTLNLTAQFFAVLKDCAATEVYISSLYYRTTKEDWHETTNVARLSFASALIGAGCAQVPDTRLPPDLVEGLSWDERWVIPASLGARGKGVPLHPDPTLSDELRRVAGQVPTYAQLLNDTATEIERLKETTEVLRSSISWDCNAEDEDDDDAITIGSAEDADLFEDDGPPWGTRHTVEIATQIGLYSLEQEVEGVQAPTHKEVLTHVEQLASNLAARFDLDAGLSLTEMIELLTKSQP